MHASILLVAALAAAPGFAAPVFPELNINAASPGELVFLSEYFNMLAVKVQESRNMAVAPVCDLTKASLPVAPTPLPTPAASLTLKHVAIGRGTQNYTCDVNNATAPPVAIGAVAVLFNASCIASTYPQLLDIIPKVALQFNLSADLEETPRIAPTTNLVISGHHLFTTVTTPFFSLDTASQSLGEGGFAKANTTAAPADAAKGQKGENAVPWLRLTAKPGATGGLQEVYRVQTAGGSAPATCAGMPASFEVQYSAQYWFYETGNSN